MVLVQENIGLTLGQKTYIGRKINMEIKYKSKHVKLILVKTVTQHELPIYSDDTSCIYHCTVINSYIHHKLDSKYIAKFMHLIFHTVFCKCNSRILWHNQY